MKNNDARYELTDEGRALKVTEDTDLAWLEEQFDLAMRRARRRRLRRRMAEALFTFSALALVVALCYFVLAIIP